MCVCIYIYIYIYPYIYILHTYINVYTYIYLSIFLSVHLYTYMPVCIKVYYLCDTAVRFRLREGGAALSVAEADGLVRQLVCL